jgi:NADPH:quinone reductase
MSAATETPAPATTHAVRIHETGGPEVLRWEEVEVPAPEAGEVLLRQGAVGLNFIDTYHRSGLYPLPSLPAVLGSEGAGTVEAVGEGVTGLAVGERVAYALAPGAYAERRVVAADKLVPLPPGISEETAAAMMLKGLTAEYLLRRTFRVEAGMTVLVHAAAGGVGSILCQWAAALGATVIGTVGSAAKAEEARGRGCHHPIVYTEEDFVARVGELTGGRGVPVVYDGVGKATFEGSLRCLTPRGLMVTYGNASGAVPPFDVLQLSRLGSLYLTRPTLATYTAHRSDLLAASQELFAAVASGQVTIPIGQRYPLAEAARAHRDLEARKTTGSTVLVP